VLNCYISDQIAEHCNADVESYCEVCGSTVTLELENSYELLVCDSCDHKVWADGEEYNN